MGNDRGVVSLSGHRDGIERLGLEDKTVGPANLDDWREVVDRTVNTRHQVTVAMVGKYVEHHDAYKSLTEAITHGLRQRIQVEILRVESEDLDGGDLSQIRDADAILVPGGFGERGFEGKVNAIRHARQNRIPYLGICYGMQAAVVEFARNVCGLEGAHTTEIEPRTPHPVIGLITEWLDSSGKVERRDEGSDLGGTMRLGGQDCRLREGSLAHRLYGRQVITERHRHRYEFNNRYRDVLQKHGMVLAGLSMGEMLVRNHRAADTPGSWAAVPPGILSSPRCAPLLPASSGGVARAAGELPAGIARLWLCGFRPACNTPFS
jgi:CTP synthase